MEKIAEKAVADIKAEVGKLEVKKKELKTTLKSEKKSSKVVGKVANFNAKMRYFVNGDGNIEETDPTNAQYIKRAALKKEVKGLTQEIRKLRAKATGFRKGAILVGKKSVDPAVRKAKKDLRQKISLMKKENARAAKAGTITTPMIEKLKSAMEEYSQYK